MSHSMPDYGLYAALKTIHALADMAELAARLGSIVTFDRRGNVIWLDDFEDNINKWSQTLVGTGAAASLSNEAARNGAKSCKLTTGSTSGKYSEIYRGIGIAARSRIGFEFSLADIDENTRLSVACTFHDGTNYYQAYLDYALSTRTLRIYDHALGYVTLSQALDLWSDPALWHTIKMVVDFDTRKYVRLLVNADVFDLSAYTLQTVAEVEASRVSSTIRLTSLGTGNLIVYVDDVILTQNEP